MLGYLKKSHINHVLHGQKEEEKKKASEVCFPKLKRREAPSKACGKLPRLLGRLKNGIGNFCINKNPK